MYQNYHTSSVPQVVWPIPTMQTHNLTTDVQIGRLKIGDMISLCTYVPAVVIVITWYIAVTNGDVVPWPVMITDCASYYPQNILFRIGLLVPLFYWGICVLLVKWWIKAGSLSIYGIVESPSIIEYIGYISLICYGFTISTIDQGQTATHFHGACAVIFLALQMIYNITVTLTLESIRQVNPKFISEFSLLRKKILCWLWIIPVGALIYEAIYDNKYGIALAEWVGVYIIIFYTQSFSEDLKHYEVTINDEGFKLSEYKRDIGYAADQCVDENGNAANQIIRKLKQSNDLATPIVPSNEQYFYNSYMKSNGEVYDNNMPVPGYQQPNANFGSKNLYPFGKPVSVIEKNNGEGSIEMKAWKCENQQFRAAPIQQEINLEEPKDQNIKQGQVYFYNPINGQLYPSQAAASAAFINK